MEQGTFQLFLGAMSIIALFVFIALYFVKAGYGMFRTASWGISINNKLACYYFGGIQHDIIQLFL